MRNYLIPPGFLVRTPEIVRVSDGSVIRPTTHLVSGPATLGLSGSRFAEGLIRCVVANAALF
eukprot:gene7200-9168_t